MQQLWNGTNPQGPKMHLLLAYVADLELEVDRLRKQGYLLRHEARESVRRVKQLCAGAASAIRCWRLPMASRSCRCLLKQAVPTSLWRCRPAAAA